MPMDPVRPSSKRPKPLAIPVNVPMDDMGYDVLVGPGMLDRLGQETRRALPDARRIMLVSDSNVMPLYGDRVVDQLQSADFEVARMQVPAGEPSKNPQQVVDVVEAMIAGGLGRKDAVVALGGGVIGDLAGFAAASFMRGVPFIQVPTSLLAQVDASVGGKVAVDLPSGKNLLGAFHFPDLVVIDPSVLSTLDDRQLGCGLAEMLKHAALFAPEQFDTLVASSDELYARSPDLTARLVAASVALKANCVSRDPHEQRDAGKGRVALNLGHTIGHAIEHASNFDVLHGEAVALGLVAAARLSERRGLAASGLEDKMVSALRALRLPVELDAWLTDARIPAVAAALEKDKKRGHTTTSYVALCRLGEPTVLQLTGQEMLALIRS